MADVRDAWFYQKRLDWLMIKPQKFYLFILKLENKRRSWSAPLSSPEAGLQHSSHKSSLFLSSDSVFHLISPLSSIVTLASLFHNIHRQ
jgi:hypothetical protein